MIKRIFNKEDIENLYLQDGQTVKSVAKYFKTNTTRITKILNESTNEHVLNKKSHPNKGKKIPKPKRHQGKVCEICGDDNGIRYSKEINKCLCSKHYQQVYLYGRILERTYFDKNDLIEHDEFIEIILRDKNCDEVGIALVSIEHLEKIKKHKWHLRSDGYVECRINKKIMLLHRFVTNAKSEEYVDHIDRNKLNNLDSNLRIVCCSENGVNKGLMSNNTSGVAGVTWDKARNKWKVSLNIYNKCYNLGRFDDFDEAVKVRKEAEEKYHGEYMPIERRKTN